MKRQLISQERIVELVRNQQLRLLEEVEYEGKTPVCEELAELIGILVINRWTPDKKWPIATRVKWVADWRLHFFMYENVCNVSGMKARDHPSLSNKAVFKHMDIRDALDKLMSES